MASYLERVNAVILRELSECLRSRYGTASVRITLTGVETESNLQRAKIFYAVIGDKTEKALAKKNLKSWSGSLRKALADSNLLKMLPTLQFIFDDSMERGSRIVTLLDTLDSGDDSKK